MGRTLGINGVPSIEKHETCDGNGGARALGVLGLLGGRVRWPPTLVATDMAMAGDDSPSDTVERVFEYLRCLDRELVVGEEGG